MIKKLLDKAILFIEKIFKTKITTLSFELAKSLMVGGLGVIINLSAFTLLDVFGIISKGDVISMKIILEKGIGAILTRNIIKTLFFQILINIFMSAISFVLQKYFTFQKKYNTASQIRRFLVQSAIYFIIDTFLTLMLYNVLKLPSFIAKLISVGILFFYSFLTQKLWIFKTKTEEVQN
jgi:putative flippase GtrA